jgi:hypothetical protein
MTKKDGKMVKGDLVDRYFPDEESIFRFLKIVFKSPKERIDGRSVEYIV